MGNVALLQTLPLFAGVPEEQLAALAARARVRSYAAGELIVGQDESPRGFYVVVSGRVKLFKVSAEGREQTVYAFGPGEPFCLCSVFEGEKFPANAAALEDSRVLVAPPDVFESVARAEPSLLFNILLVLSRRLKDAMTLVESLSLKEVPQRVAAYLLQAPQEDGRVDLPVTHRELAKIVGTTPESLSRSLRRMAEAGLVSVEGRRVTLLDRAGLERCSEEGL
ncbi:Crp/Fnr family transcriptional regulator [Desulfocurvus sp. DL9XJH121]